MIRVLAFDLDDTLLRSDGSVSRETLELVTRWLAAGNHALIATGRPPRTVYSDLPEPLQSLPWVCYNGAEVRIQGRKVFEDLIPLEEARHLIDLGQSVLPDWRIGLELDDRLYLNQPITGRRPFTYLPDLLEAVTAPPAKVLFSSGSWQALGKGDGLDEVYAALAPLLEANLPGTRPLLSHRYRLAQFMSATADKAAAVAHVVAGWGLGMEHVMAFGDDVNDVELLRTAAVGVAVANAVPEVLGVADRLTRSNDEEGVGAVLTELLVQSQA